MDKEEKIKRDLKKYKERLRNGESVISARAGLSRAFLKWLDKKKITPLSKPEIPDTEVYGPNKAVGPCSYCMPRGERGVKEVKECEYCKKWYCDKHIRPYRLEDDKGHPCPPYDKTEEKRKDRK